MPIDDKDLPWADSQKELRKRGWRWNRDRVWAVTLVCTIWVPGLKSTWETVGPGKIQSQRMRSILGDKGNVRSVAHGLEARGQSGSSKSDSQLKNLDVYMLLGPMHKCVYGGGCLSMVNLTLFCCGAVGSKEDSSSGWGILPPSYTAASVTENSQGDIRHLEAECLPLRF